MSHRGRLIAVVLPLLLLGFMTARAEWQLSNSETWLFRMGGYDPRDLLRGHYLRFRLDTTLLPGGGACDRDDPDCCYCLTEGDRIGVAGVEAQTTLMPCPEAAAECEDYVRTRPLHALNRFYIAEDGRRALESRLVEATEANQAHLAVAVSAGGDPMIRGVLVGGVPIEASVEEDSGADFETDAGLSTP